MKMTCPFSDMDLTDPRNCKSTVEFSITQQLWNTGLCYDVE